MGDSNSELIKGIVHYQQCLEKYTKRNDESRMLYCIGKLYKMPITVEHLEQTGVGRTVNSLRKFNGEVGDAAKSLVSKWKEMVMVVGEENDAKEVPVKAENSKNYRDESKDKKHKEKSSSSSHKETDRKSKYDNKDKNSSSYSNGDESSSRKEDHRSKHKSHKKDKESKHHKHKSSKRKHSSDTSDSESDQYERTQTSNHKDHKSSKYKTEDTEDENEQEMEESRSNKYKSSSKRKHEDSDDDEEYDQIKTKHRKYSENEESSDSEIEDKQEKPSHKYYSKHKEESHSSKDSKEKSKHHHKYKDKKEKKDDSNEDKSRKHTDDQKVKEKLSSKDKVKSNSNSEKREREETSKKSKHSSKHHNKEHKSSKKSSTQSKDDVDEGGIGSGSGTSFAEALGMLLPTSSKASKKKVATVQAFPSERHVDNNASTSDASKTEALDLLKQKKLEPLDLNIASLLPEITPNYRPIGGFSDNGHSRNKMTSEDETLSAIMYNKISRTKVYSGNKVIWGKVPTLFELCTRVLQDNIDALEYTGGVPYSILKPVIERANPDQLYMLEHHNPYLIDETDALWQFHCQKEFRTKKREEMESWRDMYMRCLDEREAKLKALTANIKQSQDKSLPVRQTKLAYVDSHSIVKPPRSVARKQAKHGTGRAGVEKKPAVTPSSRLSALATAGAAGQIAVPNPGARAASTGNSSAAIKPKKAPLMQKTLAFMKNRLFRR